MHELQRSPVGVDTSLLQGMVSCHNRIRLEEGEATTENLFRESDPLALAHFIKSVDILLDSAPSLVIIPNANIGHMGSLGDFYLDLMEKRIVKATAKHQFIKSQGKDYYRVFLEYMQDVPLARQHAVNWAWFQFLDTDVLLGYSDRMDVDKDRVWVKDDMKKDLVSALREVDVQRRRRIAASVEQSSIDLKHKVEDIQHLIEDLRSYRIDRASEAADTARDLMEEIKSYRGTCHELQIPEECYTAVFILAYVGSCCRRGWQYYAAYSALPSDMDTIYLAHQLRADFLNHSRDLESPGREKNVRTYYWSWGNLLVSAISQRPSVWSFEQIAVALEKIMKTRMPISVDGESPELILHASRTHCEGLRNLAEEAGIVVSQKAKSDRLNAYSKAAVRVLPTAIAGTFGEVLGQIVGMPGVGLTAGVSATEYLIRQIGGRANPSTADADRFLHQRDLC